MKIKKIDMIFIAVIGTILVSLCYFTFLKVNEMKSIKEQLKTVSLESLKEKGISAKLNEMVKEINNIKNRTKEFENQLPSKGNIEDFIVQINDIAEKSGMEISGIRPQAEVQKDSYGEIPITINAHAKYQEVYSFLYLLKKISRINKLESISVKSQDTETNKCDVNMVIKIFVSEK
ncbi:MAG: hypothetical protein A2W05_02055 [Candidatus Schekmanbacteria bacterium RBG_16_38_10]|uniref:Pilus assembly protein PilO n=1 Tax=Candidatus Schekmanbacteria bacterium RBG_16_38_10 TaxID=1817879 RepID=A0A1F7RT01_9BACT|nr:MAG: hypothetical protein A2W05_02055 [Candidatus Schekmanbacteria bacterium RBG_16_38_10]